MDLVILVIMLAIIGFVVWLITARVPMPPYWAMIIQIAAAILVLLYLLRRFGGLPNVL